MSKMNMPGFTADESLYQTVEWYHMGGMSEYMMGSGEVLPQLCASSPCLNLNVGRFCVNLPVLGRRCVNIPGFGRWRIRCCTRWGWPPVSCSVNRC